MNNIPIPSNNDLEELKQGATTLKYDLALYKKPDSIKEDFNVVRDNIYNLISIAEKLLNKCIYICDDAESPKAFEVAGQLFKNAVEVNMTLLEIQKKYSEKEEKEDSEQTVTNNILFNGTTSNLQKLLNKDNKNENTE